MAITPADKTKASINWFTGKARSPLGYRKLIVGSEDRGRAPTATVIGKMYFFAYDPKHKDTLPVYDRFPLVFPIERYTDGFLGINLHYLIPGERTWLLTKLSQFSSNSKMNSTTRLRLTYDLLQTTKRLASVTRPCIKRYLFGHVRSRLIEVFPEEWYNAVDLPVALFEYNRKK